MKTRHAILQLDFDGTLVEGDVNEGLFRRFAGEVWTARIEAASHELQGDPSSPALIDALKDASSHLGASDADCLSFAIENNPPREGLGDLVETAQRFGMECHVVSYGFDFYIRHYLEVAGVEDKLEVHSGVASLGPAGRSLTYTGPQGQNVNGDWKVVWTRELRQRAEMLVYAGDGGSDVAPAQLCDVVFARDKLLELMPAARVDTLRPFETLHDIARGLEALFG